jgi:hypothetical protein
MTNQSKWSAAKKFCDDRNWKFVILTEKNFNFKYFNEAIKLIL